MSDERRRLESIRQLLPPLHDATADAVTALQNMQTALRSLNGALRDVATNAKTNVAPSKMFFHFEFTFISSGD